jgi:probable phosphoglycerate mutase
MMIYLTRHGKTDFNKDRRLSGSDQAQLIEEGILQAKKLSENLSNEKIEIIYSSPYKKR